jgi:hypothetical protein
VPPARVTLLPPSAFADALAAARSPARCLLATGQSPSPVGDDWADRFGLLDLSGSRPRVLLDGWLARASLPELSARAPDTPRGGWDVMFATRWKWAWGGAPFAVWSPRGRVLEVLAPGRARVFSFLRQEDVAVDRILGQVSEGWVKHRVGLATTSERTVWIAGRTELAPVLDVTYDGLNLLADASWVQDVGVSLARALAVPYEGNDVATGKA